MKQPSLVSRFLFFFLLLVFSLSACKKVNEATELGNDLIPAVDNVYTFDTTLTLSSFNYPFTTEDSSKSAYTDTHFIGAITNDPLFGLSNAALFLQLKPQTYPTPFAFGAASNIIGLDSVVMVLSYRSIYGDSTLPQTVKVYELDQSNAFVPDSAYLIHQNNFTYSNPVSAPVTFLPFALNDSLTTFRERAANQLRIRLDDAFGNRLLGYDSTNAYKNDSVFNTYVKGFAVVPEGSTGNALVGVSLADTNTKLAVYYRYAKDGKTDTAVTYFRFNTSSSASANYIQRDRNGSEFATVAGDNIEDQLVYLQNAPGTFAKLLAPGLATLSNRVVHRAELIVEQVADPLSKTFPPPALLYLDAYDAANNVYRTIPVDVTLGQSGELNISDFGMLPVRDTDASGNPISVWRFNISRYVQGVANKTLPAYDFRLYSPFYTYTNFGTSTTARLFAINPTAAAGRVRVGGGNHTSQPMRIRIIYSKL